MRNSQGQAKDAVRLANFGMIRVNDRRRVDRRPTLPGMLMSVYCYSLGVAARPSATLVPRFRGAYRSARYAEPEQWPNNFTYSHPCRERQGIKLMCSPRNALLLTEPRNHLAQAPSYPSGWKTVVRSSCMVGVWQRPALTAGELLDVMQEFKGKGARPRRKRRRPS
jgi:hypothetical protein